MTSRPATSFSNMNRLTRLKTRSVSPKNLSINNKKLYSARLDFLHTRNSNFNFDMRPSIKDPECKELQFQLKILKTQLNQINTERNMIESSFTATKTELFKIEQNDKSATTKVFSLQYKKNNMKKSLKDLVNKIECSLIDYESYKHILERMKISLFFLDIKLHKKKNDLIIRTEVCKDELTKCIKVYETTGRHSRNLRNIS